MSNRYERLLSPVRVGTTIIKNRMAYPNASPHYLNGPETWPGEGFRSFQARLARAGAAIISLAEWDNYPAQRTPPEPDGFAFDDSCRMQAFDLSDPSVFNYLSQMADEVHFYGSKLLICTQVRMPEGYSLNGGPSFGPMGAPCEMLPRERIPAVIEDYVRSLLPYKRCGYDGITLRLDMQMQPSPFKRNDDYGGDRVVERMRFYIELMRRVKEVYGPGFIIEVCFAGEQPDGYGYGGGEVSGYSLEDATEFALALNGVADILQIRERNAGLAHPLSFNMKKGRHETVRYCETMKRAGVTALLAPNGGFQDPDEMERYLAEGKCDFFYLARGFIADFDFIRKVKAQHGEDIRPCLKCNRCHGIITRGKAGPYRSECSVNPLMGIEYKLGRMVDAVTEPKKVAVIGGGVAGMQAAITASERGHSVTLYEKTGRLGGQINHGDCFSFKWTFADYRDWLVRQLEKNGVEVLLNTEPSPEAIREAGFDAVLAATGATAVYPDSIEGLFDADGKALYPTCHDVIGKEAELGKSVVIVGGSETGVETGMYLAENGHDVTILTRQGRLADDASDLHYVRWCDVDKNGRWLAAWDKYDNLKSVFHATTKAVSGGTVTYVTEDGQTHTITADSVVICGGVTPNIDQALSYSSCAADFFAIGDCNGAGNVQTCTREAFSKAMLL